MEELLKLLYHHSMDLDVDHVEPCALRGLRSGYLSMYRLGLLYPWTLAGLTDLVPVHGRIKAIGWRLEFLSRDADIPMSERVDYVADLLGSYVMGIDSEFVSKGLEIAWKLLHVRGEERMPLPCRTAGICNLLCQCHYFTGDEACLASARGLVMEAIGRSGSWRGGELLEWRDALQLYANVSDTAGETTVERERLEDELRRLEVRAERVENGVLDMMRQGGGMDDVVALARIFAIVARRLLETYTVVEGKRI